MKGLTAEERDMLSWPDVDLDEFDPSQVPRATAREHVIAEGLVAVQRARWVWTTNPGGIEHKLLKDSEWTQKALRVDEIVRSLEALR